MEESYFNDKFIPSVEPLELSYEDSGLSLPTEQSTSPDGLLPTEESTSPDERLPTVESTSPDSYCQRQNPQQWMGYYPL